MLSHFSRVWFFVTLWPVAPPGFPVHGILQGRILERVAMPSSCPRDQTHVSCVSSTPGRFFTTEPPGKPQLTLYLLCTSNYTSKANSKKKGSDLWSPEEKGIKGDCMKAAKWHKPLVIGWINRTECTTWIQLTLLYVVYESCSES